MAVCRHLGRFGGGWIKIATLSGKSGLRERWGLAGKWRGGVGTGGKQAPGKRLQGDPGEGGHVASMGDIGDGRWVHGRMVGTEGFAGSCGLLGSVGELEGWGLLLPPPGTKGCF